MMDEQAGYFGDSQDPSVGKLAGWDGAAEMRQDGRVNKG